MVCQEAPASVQVRASWNITTPGLQEAFEVQCKAEPFQPSIQINPQPKQHGSKPHTPRSLKPSLPCAPLSQLNFAILLLALLARYAQSGPFQGSCYHTSLLPERLGRNCYTQMREGGFVWVALPCEGPSWCCLVNRSKKGVNRKLRVTENRVAGALECKRPIHMKETSGGERLKCPCSHKCVQATKHPNINNVTVSDCNLGDWT